MTIFTTIKFVSQQACRRVHEWVESTVGLLVDMVYKMRVWALILVYNVSRVFWGVFESFTWVLGRPGDVYLLLRMH